MRKANSVTAFRWPTATVSCPPDMRVTGGGGRCSGLGIQGKSVGYVFLVNNFGDEHQWYVTCDSPQYEQDVTAEAIVYCSS